jgi:hypothetical protein
VRRNVALLCEAPRGAQGTRSQNGWLTRAFFVGDTGLEPVTSSVSARPNSRLGTADERDGSPLASAEILPPAWPLSSRTTSRLRPTDTV